MFENFENAKLKKLPVWAGPLIIASIVAHVAGFTGMWIKSMWTIEKIKPPKNEVVSLAPPPPPPPPPPSAGKKPEQPKEIKPKKRVVKEEIIQPVREEEKAPEVQSDNSNTDTVDCLPPNCSESGPGDPAGVVTEAPPLPEPPKPPPPPPPPQTVAPTALEAQRIAGDKQIAPDDVTKTEIQRAGKNRVQATVKLCLNAAGNVENLQMLKSSGFPSYDEKIKRGMRTWRYRPFQVNGKATPVCTAVTFIYQQS